MGGPSKKTIATQESITQDQLALARRSEDRADKTYKNFEESTAPAMKYYKDIASGGPGFMTAIAPIISEIDSGKRKTRESIYESLPAGPARDIAIAENERAGYGDVAKAKNYSFIDALDKLANIGSGMGSFSLQNTGAALSGTSAAASTNRSVLEAQSAAKAAKMGMIGDLVGAAGTAASGGVFGKLG